MSFGAPLFLLGLLLLPLAVAAWLARRRRTRRYAIRFPATASAALAVGRTPAWRPLVPMTLLLASLAALVVALAKPEHTVAEPVERATIMLVTDHSRSMESDDVSPDRLAAAQKAANSFLDQVPSKVRVGIVAFSTAPDAVQTPTTDRSPVRQVINSQFPDGATATGDALTVALQSITQDTGPGTGGKRPPSAIALLSDGKTTEGRDPIEIARRAAKLKIPVSTVALGTPDGTVPGGPFGQPLSVPEGDFRMRGHAMEFRVNAEDPRTFAPNPGRIKEFNVPGGPGVRVDTAAYRDYVIPPHYDSLIAKLVIPISLATSITCTTAP